MTEIANIDGLRFAIVRDYLESSDDIELISGVDGLWLRPEVDGFQLRSALHIPHLRHLSIANCRQPILQLVTRESVANVEVLLFAESENVFTGICGLGKLLKLKTLGTHRQFLTAEAVDWIVEQDNVATLSMTDADVSDGTLARLTCREHLEFLRVYRTNVTLSHGNLFKGPFPLVRSLDVSDTPVGSSSVDIIRMLFPGLQRLLAENTNLRMDDLRRIASWDTMKILYTNTPSIDFGDYHELWS